MQGGFVFKFTSTEDTGGRWWGGGPGGPGEGVQSFPTRNPSWIPSLYLFYTFTRWLVNTVYTISFMPFCALYCTNTCIQTYTSFTAPDIYNSDLRATHTAFMVYELFFLSI